MIKLRDITKVIDEPVWVNYWVTGDSYSDLYKSSYDIPIEMLDKVVTYMTVGADGVMTIEVADPLYKYGMKLRGYSIGCQPSEGLVQSESDQTGRYWDVLVYNRELTDKELEEYDLELVLEGYKDPLAWDWESSF